MFCIAIVLFCTAHSFGQSQAVPQGYGVSSYKAETKGQYMKHWLLAGPVKMTFTGTAPDMQAQELFFREDSSFNIKVTPDKPITPYEYKSKKYAWRSYSSSGDIIDLDSVFNKADYAAAYAMGEIVAPGKKTVLLAVGSDDGVKVWHNGKVVHENWIPRGLVPDQDVFPIELKKGSNQIVIKVQDIAGGWGFTARILDDVSVSERFVSACGSGLLDEINMFLDAGANINFVNDVGLSAIGNAQIKGRDEVVKLLTKKGATHHPVPPPEILTYGLYKWLNDKDAPGVAVLVAKDGKVLYTNGFGFADIARKERILPDTKFRIGSITKQFVASAILKLEEEGRLKRSDKLDKYFPDFPRGSEVTIQHLLTHTSGIHSYTGKDDFTTRVIGPITPEELINYFKNDPYDFNPGDAFLYNNSGYFLLGLMIEKITGKSYGHFLKSRFFDPLDMKNTGVYSSSLKLTKEAKGYTSENGRYERALDWNMDWAGGAGALYATVEDLYKWNEAVFNGKVLSEASLKAALTAGVLNNGQPISNGSYGYGWVLNEFRGEEVAQHGGGLHGFVSQLSRYRNNNLTIVILTNLTPPEVELNANIIAEYFLWDKLDKQTSFSEKASANQNVKVFEGRYDFTNGAVMTITAEGNNLFAQLSGQAKFPIFPSGESEFFWKVVPAKIKFEKDENGNVIYGDFSQNGQQIKVMKLKEAKIIQVDPAIFKNFTGKYDYGNNMIITITEENGKLFAQATNQPKFELFPVSEKEYVLKDLNAKVIFEDKDGKVSNMIVDMAGQQKAAPRME